MTYRPTLLLITALLLLAAAWFAWDELTTLYRTLLIFTEGVSVQIGE